MKDRRAILPRELPLLLAVFLDLAGFGMVLPDIQTRLEGMGARGWLIGAVFSSYFVAQAVASPLWGRWSDRVGRKPVLLWCGSLSAAALLLYAGAGSVAWLFASRVLAGLGGANVVAAQAYLADTSEDAERTNALGRMGVAITGGLLLGPVIGGFLSSVGGHVLLGGIAAALSFSGVLWIALSVRSVPPGRPTDDTKGTKGATVTRGFDWGWNLLRDVPAARGLFLLAAGAYFALACLEGTFGRLILHKLGLGALYFGLIFGYEAFLGVVTQTVILPWTNRRFPPYTLLRFAYLMQGVGLAVTPLAPNLWCLFAASTLFAVGTGLANPTVQGVGSAAVPPDRQGELFGLLQATRSLGFLVGPILGGVLFDWHPEAPYFLAGAVLALAGVATVLPASPVPPTVAGSASQ